MLPPAATGVRPGYLPALDGLRGLAAALVVLYHFAWFVQPWLDPNPAARNLWWTVSFHGWVGVDLFFVVSGYLITRILLQRGSLKVFWARRALRILPLAFVYVVFLKLNAWWGDPLGVLRSFPGWGWYLLYLGNLHIAATGWHPIPVMLLWSLAIEEQFYLVWPLVTRALTPPRLLAISAGLLLTTPLVRWLTATQEGYPAVYVGTFCRLDGLAMGCGLALVLNEQVWASRVLDTCRRLWPLGLAILAGVVALNLGPSPGTQNQPLVFSLFGYSVIAGAWTLVVGAALAPGRFARLLGMAPLRKLGKISYGLYVWHGVAGLALRTALQRHDALPGPFVLVLLMAGATLAVAVMSWLCLERPLLKLKPTET